MKKFYAFAAAALCALAANAQDGAPLYATGDGGFAAGNWNPAEPDEFVYADGVYTLEVANLQAIKISTAKGSWDEFGAGVVGCKYGKKPGVPTPLEAGYGNNINTPWLGDYTVTVAGDLSTITLSTDTPGEVLPTVLYLRGDINDWTAPEEWKMEEVKEDLIYKFTCAEGQVIKASQNFKIADDAWKEYNIGSTTDAPLELIVGNDMEVSNGADPKALFFAEDFSGVMYINLDIDGQAYLWTSDDKTATPEWLGEGAVNSIAADNNVAVKYFNLQGVQVANPENGLFIVVKGNKASKVLVK